MGFGLILFGSKVMMIVGMIKIFFAKKDPKFCAIFYGICYFLWSLLLANNGFLASFVLTLLLSTATFAWLYWLLNREVDGVFYGLLVGGSLVLLVV